MLLPTMPVDEVTREIMTDWNSRVQSTIIRLGDEYARERKKLKIDKGATYSRVYPIKTNSKNNWLFFFSKSPSVGIFKGVETTNVQSLVYYYTAHGLRAFKIIPTGGLDVYNGHVFARYNERLNLGISEPLERIKVFFVNNGYSLSQTVEREGKQLTISCCRDGLLLGELQHNNKWLVNKTFITRDLASLRQLALEDDLVAWLQTGIEELLNEPDFDVDRYNYNADIMKGIR